MTSWNDLGSHDAEAVADARLAIHHAAQLAAIGVAKALVPVRDDDSHTTLVWQAGAEQWISVPLPGTDDLRAGLRPADLTLTLGPSSDPARHRMPLGDKTLADGLDWLRRTLGDVGVDTDGIALDFHYEMPTHPVVTGGRFAEPAGGHSEVAAWYAAADDALRVVVDDLASPDDDPSTIRTWPHHFDVATLLTVGEGKTIGVGMTPGDDSYREPYWYVGPYPHPAADDLPPLPRGHWHTDGFFAAILDAPTLVAIEPAGRRRAVLVFLDMAIGGCRQLLA
ncbi:MAG: hypothetical protein AAGE94_05705 [Acidobacteriota bacterium]